MGRNNVNRVGGEMLAVRLSPQTREHLHDATAAVLDRWPDANSGKVLAALLAAADKDQKLLLRAYRAAEKEGK